MNMIILSVVAFVVAIGVLVAVHEWGHYIVARLVGVKVQRFSIGFGKRILSVRAGPDDTEYCLSAIPLGGYVKLLDEREAEVPASERHRSFNRQPVSSRIAILLAGPAMNFLFAVLAFWLMFVVGIPGFVPKVGEVEPASIAARAGIEAGDQFIAINGTPVATWDGAVLGLFDGMLAGDSISVEMGSEDGSHRVTRLDVSDRLRELTEPGNLLQGIGLTIWTPVVKAVIAEISPGGSAEESGLLPGDEIVGAAGESIRTWPQWVKFVQERPGQTINTRVLRGGNEVRLPLSIGVKVLDDGTQVGFIGAGVDIPADLYAGMEAEQRYTGTLALTRAIDRTWSMSELTVRMIFRMVTGEVSAKNISGPINIAQYAGYSASIGISSFLRFLAIVSLSLGILNLLPVPILDGGQVVYQLLEAIKGRPLSEKAQILGQQIGIAFLVLVMGFAFYNDLTRVFS